MAHDVGVRFPLECLHREHDVGQTRVLEPFEPVQKLQPVADERDFRDAVSAQVRNESNEVVAQPGFESCQGDLGDAAFTPDAA